MEIKFEKTQKIFAYIFGIIAIGFALLLIPAIQNLIILMTEKFIVHRLLEDHGKWISLMKKIGIVVSIPCILLSSLLFIEKDIVKQVFNICCVIHKKIVCVLENLHVFLSEKSKSIEYKETFSQLKLPFVELSIIYAIALLALLLTNSPYNDDYQRIAIGNDMGTAWNRYFAIFLGRILNTDRYMFDIAPITQIIAIILMAATSAICIYVLSNGRKITQFSILASIPMALSPYFLECFSYRFDSPYMAFSVFISVIPLLFYNAGNISYCISAFLCMLMMSTTYQASSGIFPVLVIFVALIKWNDGIETKKVFKFVGLSVLSFLLAMIFFKIFIAHKCVSYASTEMLPLKILVPGFFSNLLKYYKLVIFDFRTLWNILIIIIAFAFLIKTIIDSKQKKSIALIVNFALLGAAGLLTFGVYPALERPLFVTRAMYGAGFTIAMICISSAFYKKFVLVKFLTVILSYCFIIFATIYGNAQHQNDLYTEYRMQCLLSDLNEIEAMQSEQITKIRIQGSIGLAPVIENKSSKYKNLFYKLVKGPLSPGYTTSEWLLNQYFFNYFNIKNIRATDENLNDMNLPILKDTIYGNAKYILVQLK